MVVPKEHHIQAPVTIRKTLPDGGLQETGPKPYRIEREFAGKAARCPNRIGHRRGKRAVVLVHGVV
jgi:hypothetical protein